MNTTHSTKDIKAMARHLLIGKYGVAVAICFLYTAITLFVQIIDSEISYIFPAADIVMKGIYLIVQAALAGGALNFALNVVANRDYNVMDVFYFVNPNEGVRKLIRFFLANYICLMAAFLPLGPAVLGFVLYYYGYGAIMLPIALVLLVGGILFGTYMFLSLEMTSIIIVEAYYKDGRYYTPLGRPLTVLSPLAESYEMMRGHHIKLLKLYLSFLGWILLNLLSMGIVMLWVQSYINVSVSLFYNDLLMAELEKRKGTSDQ